MKHEKNSDDWLNKKGKQQRTVPLTIKDFLLRDQRNTLLHSFYLNLVGNRILHYEPISNYLWKRNHYFMQKIVELLPRVTLEDLYDYQEFNRFINTFLVHAQYHCNSMLCHFLSGRLESMDPKPDPVSHADFLVDTLFSEIQSMNDAVAVSATIQNVNREYEGWLENKVLEEESL
jgi:hypothetical protein